MLGHRQGDGGGVWATYAPPVGIVEVHRSQWLQGEPTLHSEIWFGGAHPPTDFSKFPKASSLALWGKYNAKQRSKD